MSPTLKIDTWRYTETLVTTADHDSGSGKATTGTHRTEKITATFSIKAGPDIRYGSRSVRPYQLIVKFLATNGGRWRADLSPVTIGRNVLKDGAIGAEARKEYGHPRWVKSLVEPDGDGRSDALDWVRAEYPR